MREKTSLLVSRVLDEQQAVKVVKLDVITQMSHRLNKMQCH